MADSPKKPRVTKQGRPGATLGTARRPARALGGEGKKALIKVAPKGPGSGGRPCLVLREADVDIKRALSLMGGRPCIGGTPCGRGY